MKLRDTLTEPSIAGRLPVLLAGIGILAVLFYAGIVATPFAQGPELSLAPITTLDGQTVRIEGRALRVSRVLINGMDIPLSEAGEFSVERSFPAGYTVVTVRAEDRFGRVRERTITFITKTHAKEETSERESGATGGSNLEVGEGRSD